MNCLAIRIVGDTRNVRDITELFWNIYGSACLITSHHVDVNLSVSIGLGIETTAIDVVDAGSRLDIHRDFTMLVNWGLYATRLQRARISSFVTTTDQVLDDNGITAVGLLDVHRDVTLDTTF